MDSGAWIGFESDCGYNLPEPDSFIAFKADFYNTNNCKQPLGRIGLWIDNADRNMIEGRTFFPGGAPILTLDATPISGVIDTIGALVLGIDQTPVDTMVLAKTRNQTAYFEALNTITPQTFYYNMSDHSGTPHEIAQWVCQRNARIKSISIFGYYPNQAVDSIAFAIYADDVYAFGDTLAGAEIFSDRVSALGVNVSKGDTLTFEVDYMVSAPNGGPWQITVNWMGGGQ